MAKFWYGIQDIAFIYHGGWNDPEIEYGGLYFNPYDVEDYEFDYLKEELGREPTDDEFDQFMRSEGDDIKWQLENEGWIPTGVHSDILYEIDFTSSFPGLYELSDVKEKIDELRETTIIRDKIWDKVYATFAKYDDMDEATEEAQQVLIDEVTNPDNYEW